MESKEIRNYLVKFTFEIPVRIVGGDPAMDSEEAFFKAQDEFCEFKPSESIISVDPISESDYQVRREAIDKQHEVKW